MLTLGIAVPSTPSAFLQKDLWEKIYQALPKGIDDLQPFDLNGETPDVVQGYIDRIDTAFAKLQRLVEDSKSDAIIVIGSDNGEVFSHINVPTFCLFTGKNVKATPGAIEFPESLGKTLEIPCHSELAYELLKSLVNKGFEVSWNQELTQTASAQRYGISRMVANPLPRLSPRLDVPIIPLFLNAYFPPLPSAARCFDLGLALREALDDVPERIAIVASGGLSHDPMGRWVDEKLDRWIIEALKKGKAQNLKKLFTVDAETMRGPTGEIRAWIVAAAACARPAQILDYVPARAAKTGLCFAYWPAS